MISIDNRLFRYTAIAGAIVGLMTTTGCSSNEETTGKSVATHNLTEQEIRVAALEGATHGITANMSAFSRVLSNAAVLENVGNQIEGARALPGTSRALGTEDPDAFGANADIDSLMTTIEQIFDESTMSQDGDVYTFDPDETGICAESTATATEAAQCEAVMSNLTAEMTVNAVANDEITAATTDFLYDQMVFASIDFTPNSGYYEVAFEGLKALMQGINDVAPADEQETIPAVMTGSLRASFTVTGDDAASMLLSVTQAVTISDNSDSDPVSFALGATDLLAGLSADASNNSMTAEIGLGAISLIASDEDETGSSYPIELALSALTGKAVVSDNGDQLTLTGVGVDGLTFSVDQLSAATLDISTFGATLSTAAGINQTTLGDDFDLDLTLTNIRGYFADFFESTAETDNLILSIEAPAATQFTEIATDITQINGGPLTLSMETTGEASLFIEVADGVCLDTNADPAQAISCPTLQ